MNFENIIFEKQSQFTGILMINRPESLNAINLKTLQEINRCLDENLENIRYLVIKGSGTKAFIAGGDLKEMNSMAENDFRSFLKTGQEVTTKIENGNFLSIACVNGYALGGGFEFALACDLIFASETACFGFPEVKLGIIPGFGGNVRISRRVGLNKAKELVLSGKTINAQQAQELGFINRIVNYDNLEVEILSFVEQLSANSFNAMISAKTLINKLFYSHILSLYDEELISCINCHKTNERIERINAFIEKRKPNL